MFFRGTIRYLARPNRMTDDILKPVVMYSPCHPTFRSLAVSLVSERYIYFVLEALMGGDIFSHLHRLRSFEEPAAR